MLKLKKEELKDQAQWEEVGINPPQFDYQKLVDKTKKKPEWEKEEVTLKNSKEMLLNSVSTKKITKVNGSEFADYEWIEKFFAGSSTPRTIQYYFDAYCSWQRGSNEVANKFIRRFLPKGTSFKGIKRTLVKKIQKFINTYPRKMFDYGNSDELFREKVSFSY